MFFMYLPCYSSLTHSLPHLGIHFFKQNVGSLTGKYSAISILCLELPVNARNRVALYLTIQRQTLMQRTSHILRPGGNPRGCRGTTYVTVHSDGSPMLTLVCWPASRSMQPSLVHRPLVIMVILLCTNMWSDVCQGITGECILTRIPLGWDCNDSNISSKMWELKMEEVHQSGLQGTQIMTEQRLCRSMCTNINPLKTKRRLLYLKTQFVPRSKHFSSRL